SLSMLAIIIVIVLTPFLSKKFGFTNVMRATTLIGAFGYLIRLFAIHNIPLLFVTNMVSMMGFYTMFSFGGTFVLECIDYGEWKTGVRSEGTIACAQSVTSKIGTAVGVGLVGVLMGISGYQGSEVVQSEGSRNMIIALFSIVPAVFCIIQFVLLKVYDLDKLLPQINKDLEERRSKKNSFE
ncbi:MAG TPA: MFS transporter, partial [Candidatus Merdenecus merdavium]|nr:MFS transporter [Candidatus Merdenecus merdavium]